MATLKSRLQKSKGDEQTTAQKPASGFFDSFESSTSAASVIDQRQWREDTGSINFDPSLELQQTIERADVISQAQAARSEDRQPTSRERIEHALRPRSSLRDDGLFHLSTHRAARGDGLMSGHERKDKKEQQEARAWAMLTWLVSLGAGRS